MDEIDSIGSSRGESGSGGGDSEVQRTMLELLNQLDGFEPTKNIKVIMATNRIGSSHLLLNHSVVISWSDLIISASFRHFGLCTPSTWANRSKDRVPSTRT